MILYIVQHYACSKLPTPLFKRPELWETLDALSVTSEVRVENFGNLNIYLIRGKKRKRKRKMEGGGGGLKVNKIMKLI